MSTYTKVSANTAQVKLMDAIGQAIMTHTTFSPMTQEDIVAVIAFATGCAIGQAKTQRQRRETREVAIANIDNGIGSIDSNPAGLIIPQGVALQ